MTRLRYILAALVATIPVRPAAAQRAVAPLLAPAARANVAPVRLDRSVTDGRRAGIRALWALGGGAAGVLAGGGAGFLIAAIDGRPTSDVDAIPITILSGVGELAGITLGAAWPNVGSEPPPCSRRKRIGRAALGTAVGTAAGFALARGLQAASSSNSALISAGAVLPVAQIGGAVIALGGC